MANLKIGTVTHYFDKIGVAVVELTATINIGDVIEFEKAGFSQTVASMQMEHEEIKTAKKGQAIGLKVDQEVKAGDTVLKKS